MRPAAIAAAGVPVFAWKGRVSRRVLVVHLQALAHKGGQGAGTVVDDGGDVTLLIHKGMNWKTGIMWVDSPSGSHEEKVIKDLLERWYAEESAALHKVAAEWRGVQKRRRRCVHRLYKMLEQGKLLVPAINVNGLGDEEQVR